MSCTGAAGGVLLGAQETERQSIVDGLYGAMGQHLRFITDVVPAANGPHVETFVNVIGVSKIAPRTVDILFKLHCHDHASKTPQYCDSTLGFLYGHVIRSRDGGR